MTLYYVCSLVFKRKDKNYRIKMYIQQKNTKRGTNSFKKKIYIRYI